MISAVLLLLCASSAQAFIFPSSNAGCSCPQPVACPAASCPVPQCPQPPPCVARGQKIVGDVKPLEDIEWKAQMAGVNLERPSQSSQLEMLEKLLDNAESRFDEDHDLLHRKARQAAVKVDEDESKNTEVHANTKCNSQVLKKLMIENMNGNSSESKRAINLNAEKKFGGNIDVICSRGHFSYVYSSNLFCETSKDSVTCVAFRQSN
uniref:Ground-like domain-containing protein n=1 Tax=Steinernema glaseri TaxID=37863 RepID=A0A1I7YRC5_9BILA